MQSKGKQLPVAEAQKIYSSTLILGAGNNEVSIDERQIRLTKWDRGAFAQGAVMLAFEDLMLDRRASLVKQTLNWADATVDAKQLAK